MRIEKIFLRNYRQFRQAEITFRRRHDTDLHFIIGTNGTGKTNLLNAINWCLYGDEPHLSKDSQQLPLLNLKTVDRMDVGKENEVAVEVWTETEHGEYITFKRRAVFRKHNDRKITHEGTKFEVTFNDEKGNTKIATDEDAITWVERFVPKGIREFFFFDGERLDNYFKEATGQNIRHAVFQISQIDLLENCVERKLQDTLDDLRKEAGKTSPKIEGARTELEQAKNKLDEIEKRIKECKTQIEVAKNKVAEFGDKLKGVPDIEALEEERCKIETSLKETKELLGAKEEEKKSLLHESGSILMLWPAIKRATQIVEEKKRNQEIPPPVDKRFLEEVLRNKSCRVCGRSLDDSSSKQVQELIKEVETSSEIAQRLVQMEIPLYQFRERAGKYKEQMEDITRNITRYEKTLTEITQRKEQIDSQMAGYDEKLIREWYRERTKFEDLRDQNQRQLGGLLVMKQGAEGAVEKWQKELDTELKKEEKVKGLTKKIAFCERAVDVARSTREAIMKETRERVEVETKRQFFRLVWKKETFGDIRIKADYGIDLIHSMGYECLGSISAGEREMLALSFTLALHQASGFDSPLLIDTPVARISDVNRENFAKVLCEVSTIKQTILLFTPDEYSEEISRYLGGRASGRYSLKLTSDENEAKVEVR